MADSTLPSHADLHEKPLMLDHGTSNKPTFLSKLKPALFSSSITSRPTHGPTAYLDGLRGWAALMVYVTHHILAGYMWLPLELGYGTEGKYYFISIPIVRALFTGSHMCVHIFFVVSGYVLSRSTMKAHRDGASIEKMAGTLASATCRRFVRLWTPVIATTFVSMTIMYMVNQQGAEQKDSYIQEAQEWWQQLFSISYPASTVQWTKYNPHTWTIPYEFNGSMCVLMGLFATLKMTHSARMLCFLGYGCYHHYFANFGMSTFLFGAFLADLDLLPDEEWPQWKWLTYLQANKGKLYCILIPLALHFAGQPMLPFGSLTPLQYRDTYGFWYMLKFMPYRWLGKLNDFYYTIGALIIVTASTNLPQMRALFEMRFTQYLGRISFGLYLVHGPILFILAMRMYAATGVMVSQDAPIKDWNGYWEFGKFGPIGLQFNFLCCHIILLPLSLYLAELCTKFIDEPSATLARNVYKMMLP